jgi:Common central domain of tyrosinase
MALRCRKNQATLSAQEKSRFVAAMLVLKANGTYDQYVQTHMNAMAAAHRGPAFLPWHREYLRRLELDLQAIDSTVTLPYWDWTVDRTAGASIWAADFMGGDGRPSDGQVMTGPFAFSTGNWALAFDGPFLRRRFGASAPALPVPADVTNAINNETVYDVAPYDRFSLSGFRNRLEGWISGPQLHNLVHVWVGGSMMPMSSPNDPVFFLHHCFVDKIWADWQRANPASGYLPVSGAPPGHNLADAMSPWAAQGQTVTPASVLDHHALGYAYDNEAECQPKLKIADDIPTTKFRDDIQTLKFRDDLPTIKFRDDIPTLKFQDDPQTLKFVDDPKLKFADDPQTLKFADDPKLKFADDPSPKPIVDAPPVGPGGPGPLGPGQRSGAAAAPFVLATPHHSMAWAQSFPDAFEARLAELERQIQEYSAAIGERVDAQRRGLLTADEIQQLHALRVEYGAVLAEYQDMLGRASELPGRRG